MPISGFQCPKYKHKGVIRIFKNLFFLAKIQILLDQPKFILSQKVIYGK
jgi:hypothetical protein